MDINMHMIMSKADYIAAIASDICADRQGAPSAITEQATINDIYRQLCNIADTLDEMAPTWKDDD